MSLAFVDAQREVPEVKVFHAELGVLDLDAAVYSRDLVRGVVQVNASILFNDESLW